MAIFHLNYLNQVQIAANTSSRNRAKSIIQRFPKSVLLKKLINQRLLGRHLETTRQRGGGQQSHQQAHGQQDSPYSFSHTLFPPYTS